LWKINQIINLSGAVMHASRDRTLLNPNDWIIGVRPTTKFWIKPLTEPDEWFSLSAPIPD